MKLCSIRAGLALAACHVAQLTFAAPLAPSAVTLPPEPFVNLPRMRLFGLVNPNGLPTQAWFEWGTTTTYGNITSVTNVGEGSLALEVGAVTSNLSGGDYHYRVVASNSFGVVTGSDVPFEVTFLPLRFGLPVVYESSVASADFDRNGRLDLLIEGNLASGPARPLAANIASGENIGWDVRSYPGLTDALYMLGSVACADYNNDGLPDIFVTGHTNTGTFNGGVASLLWRNTGSSFTNVSIAGLPGTRYTSAAWGDYSNDGPPDFLLTGQTHSGPYASQLWRNTHGGFTNMAVDGLPDVQFSSVAWADYDNDGRLDFLLTGRTNLGGNSAVSQIWRNTGAGFTHVPIEGLPDISNGSVAWADYDNDNRLDFLLTGADRSNNGISQLWRNTGSGFTNVPIAGVPDVMSGSVAWLDFDNDGRFDFLLTGRTNFNFGGGISQLWRNTGNAFTNVPIPGLPGVFKSSVAATDLNNDGRLDFLITGTTDNTASGALTLIFRNYVVVTNSRPTAPAALTSGVSNGWAYLNWTPASDLQTPSAGLSYNLRVGSTPGGENIVSPLAMADGFRLVPALGNAQMRSTAMLELPPGTYYWSVQAIDSAFAGGPFAPEASFVVPGPRLSIVLSDTNAVISWPPHSFGWVLQQSASLNPPAWTNAPSGATNPIVVPADEPRFYRLGLL